MNVRSVGYVEQIRLSVDEARMRREVGKKDVEVSAQDLIPRFIAQTEIGGYTHL
jgi:hypothetical protein